ncbi:MAG: pseudouridine synthase [Gammaproteobacteria bacterium]|nr:pseudouridine synthase [Gammaproteobacteria bacterium]
MRLDRFVSQAAGVSRRQARILIQRGRILVDGDTVKDIARHVAPGEQVACAGELLALPQPVYLMLNKPCGLLSATTDSHQATVMTRLPEALAARVHPVGRLDKETSGLLLLSDDGAWSHRVTSPNHRCSKTYLAALAEPLAADAEQRLRQGLMLRSEKSVTRPAELTRLDDTHVRLSITEGRYHQVRRMFAALGNRVLTLHRERIGGLVLDPSLQPGDWRHLTAVEREAVLGSEIVD